MAIWCYRVGLVFLALGLAHCGMMGGKDDKDESDTTTSAGVPPGFSNTPVASAGTLALAFPGSMNLSSSLVADDTAAAGTTLNLAAEAVSEATTAPSAEDKQEQINSILEAEQLSDCFKLKIVSLSQPGCFAPNVQSTDIDAAAAGDNPFVVTMPSGVTQQLYGDGGIARASEGSESCTAATINYFTEEALSYIEQGRQAFATLVCISRFNEQLALPDAGGSTDFMPIIGAVQPPEGISFNTAKISAEAGADGSVVYTTELNIAIKSAKDSTANNMYAYFRHAPELSDGTQKGHVIVMRAGQSDALQSANQLLQDPPMGPPNPGGNPPQPGGEPGPANNTASALTNVASVAYEINGGTIKAALTRATFKGDNSSNDTHPAGYFDTNGLLAYHTMGAKDAGNSFADNIVDTRFTQNASSDTLGEGIVGWTASLNDGSWRSFAYRVTQDAAGAQTAQSTFGFAKGFRTGDTTSTLPTAANGMFCYWAQAMGDPQQQQQQSSSDTFLESSGPSGPAVDKVQYQVSTRASDAVPFTTVAADSNLNYTIASDCGTNELSDVTTDGSITDVFVAPTAPSFTPLGGVGLTFSEIAL